MIEKNADEFLKSLDILNDHPALYGNLATSPNGMVWYMVKIDKYGNTEDDGKHGVSLKNTVENLEKWGKYFKKGSRFSKDIPYIEIYGKPWKYAGVEYRYELSFYVFTGNVYNNDYIKPRHWCGYCGPRGKSDTFEGMVIDAAKKATEIFGGPYAYNHFYTQAESNNIHRVKAFLRKPFKKGLVEVTLNPESVLVYPGLINVRWLQVFMEMPYAKQNCKEWFSEWSTIIDRMINKEPNKRKAILKKYEI